MEYIFDIEKLERVLSDFYNSTGIAVDLYNAYEEDIAHSSIDSSYCRHIRTCAKCIAHCNQSDFIHMKEASLNRKTCRYTCHAGLMETILPVHYEGTLIGYMQIGQFRDTEGVYSGESGASDAAERYGFDVAHTLSLYRALPSVSEEKLEALQEILLIIIRSFWEDGLIRHNRSMLSVRIEQYIAEHLREKLYVERLCEEFFLSKNALYRLFAAEFGTTVGNYVLDKRVQLATRLLHDTAAPITQIAAECGFPDYNYFIRAFKKQTGLTPLQFRKNK